MEVVLAEKKINFRYIGYGNSFADEYWRKEDKVESNLYLFSDNRMKSVFVKKMKRDIFSKQPEFMTMDEFRERIFISDKIVLKEAKRILAFYKSIPQDVKDELNIKSYYDIIDFANNFFAYYREMNINDIEKIDNIHNWQEKYFYYFKRIKESFDVLCQKHNYIPNDWLEDIRYFQMKWLKKYEKIIFVDVIEYPELYKKIINKLLEEKEIEIILQLENGDFDENKLKIEKITLPEISPSRIYVYQSKDELEESMSLIYLFEEKRKSGDMYSPVPENNTYHNIFPRYFGKSQAVTMNDTKLYKFLNIQLNILMNMEEKLGRVYLISAFKKAFDDRVFREYYSLSAEDIITLNSFMREDYKYISSKILDTSEAEWIFSNNVEFRNKMENIFFDLSSIIELKGVDDIYEYFKKQINLEKFIEKEYGSIFEKFFEIFGIMKSNENMSIHNSFNTYFEGNLGSSLFRLVIQYMKDIVISSNEKVDSESAIVKNMEAARFARESRSLYKEKKMFGETNFFMDITGDILPGNIGDNLIFTEKQRKDMGMVSREEKREIKKYRFFQAVFSNINAVIFTKKNEDKGIDISPFLDELCIKYNLEIKKAPVDLNGSIEALKNSIFEKEKGYSQFEMESFPKDNEDFKDGKLSMGAYDYSNLKQCRLKFYFQKMNNLEYLCLPEESDISSRFFGILVHKVLEEIVKGMWKEVISKGNFKIDSTYIEEILNKHFSYSRAKIPVHMDNYCSEIMIPIITANIEKFFSYIETKYQNIKIKRFQGEKGVYETKPFIDGDIQIFLRGVADLVIESEIGNEIIDYKTGGANKEQLDYYSIILYEDEKKAQKYIFNVWKGNIEVHEEIKLTKEGLKEDIIDFLKSSEYSLAEKTGTCSSCEYIKICGRGR